MRVGTKIDDRIIVGAWIVLALFFTLLVMPDFIHIIRVRDLLFIAIAEAIIQKALGTKIVNHTIGSIFNIKFLILLSLCLFIMILPDLNETVFRGRDLICALWIEASMQRIVQIRKN